MCGNKLLNRMGNLCSSVVVMRGCLCFGTQTFRVCLVSMGLLGSLVTLVLIGVLGRQYWVCFTGFARGIVSPCTFGGFNAVGGVGGFAFGSHICFVP